MSRDRNRNRILEALREEIEEAVGRKVPFAEEAHLVDDLGLDSLDLLAVTIGLENRFELCLEPDDEAPLVRVGDVVAMLERKQSALAGGA